MSTLSRQHSLGAVTFRPVWEEPMPHTFSRRALYELVWSEPMQTLAKGFSLSDRGLAKICAAANIPMPGRGYWAKLRAGKDVSRLPFSERGLGQSDEVSFGGGAWAHNNDSDREILAAPIPPLPVFEPDMDVVRSQAIALVRKAPLPLRDSHGWHPQIAKLLATDDERARKQRASPYPSLWDGPIFDKPFEQRRLRLLNALFICLSRSGMKLHLSGKHGRDIFVTVGNTAVPLSLDAIGAHKRLEAERYGHPFQARGEKERMRLALSGRWSEGPDTPSWEDRPGERLERHLRDIAAAIIVFGEQEVRETAVRLRAWRIERKAALEEAERKRRAEDERARRALEAKRAQARIDHLLGHADALSRADKIRTYVAAVRERNGAAPNPMVPVALEEWCGWALAHADRIDPVLSGAYQTRPQEPTD
ncbi:MAG TPA: hypothetical protein VNJ04_09555 [Gemmatimonadaceae bacterium]|nr:hypothetical protein [Gemmatimonadaceae bacterium]